MYKIKWLVHGGLGELRVTGSLAGTIDNRLLSGANDKRAAPKSPKTPVFAWSCALPCSAMGFKVFHRVTKLLKRFQSTAARKRPSDRLPRKALRGRGHHSLVTPLDWKPLQVKSIYFHQRIDEAPSLVALLDW